MPLTKQLLCLLLTLHCATCLRQDGLKKEVGRKRADFERLFDVFDPVFLGTVWPKINNGVHLALEPACWEQLTVLFTDLADGRAWAYNAADASGRYEGGLFAGRRFWLGSKQQCLQLNNDIDERANNETIALLRNQEHLKSLIRRQKYFDAETKEWRWAAEAGALVARLAAADGRAPLALAYTALTLHLNLTKITMLKSYEIILGLCLPSSCTPSDVETLVNFSIMLADNLKGEQGAARGARATAARRVQPGFPLEHDAGAIALVTVTALLLLVVLIATVVDLDLARCLRYKKQSMSFDLPTYTNSETKLVDELKRKHEVKSVEDILAESVSLPPLPRLTDAVGSCARCGKYRRQCPNTGKPAEHSAPCPRLNYSSFASLGSEDRLKNVFFCRLLLCFSLCYTWRRLFNKHTANRDLSLVHVGKVVATLWIMFIHVAVMVGYISDNVGDLNDPYNLYRNILTTGTLAFDTMFFVSGLFSAHHFFYLRSRYSVEQLVSFRGLCGDIMHFFCTVTNRLIRQVPPYAYAVLASAVAARAARGSALVLPDGDHNNCDVHWWRNLLYVTNLFPQQQQCLQISWYLSVETQLHAAGAAACVCARGGLRSRLVLAAGAALAVAAAAADLAAYYRDGEVLYWSTYEAYWWVLERGCARVAPYCAGLLAGWLVHRLQGRLQLTKLLWWSLWGASLALCLGGAVAAGAAPARLAAAAHLAWPAALLWPALLACTAHAEWWRGAWGAAGAALSRASGAALLLHYAVARLLLVGDAPLCSHLACVLTYWAGAACASLVAAMLLCLLLELPFCGLYRRLSDAAV